MPQEILGGCLSMRTSNSNESAVLDSLSDFTSQRRESSTCILDEERREASIYRGNGKACTILDRLFGISISISSLSRKCNKERAWLDLTGINFGILRDDSLRIKVNNLGANNFSNL